MADAPNGVQKLRELILQLAVRGKLVPQDSSDEPASLLLKQIAEKVERHYANGGIGKPTTADLLAADDIPHHVPDSWRWVRLSSVGAIIGGGTPKTEVAAYWIDDGGVPWLTPADLNGLGSKYAHGGRRQISQLGLENSAAQILPTGSVLFSSRAPIGYVAIAANPIATNQGFKSCVPYVGLMSDFIFRFLQAVGPEVDRKAPGTTFREVSGKIVGQIPFPLPPLAEQRRITAKVEELMALCDTLEAQQQRRTVARMRLNRSALHQLTTTSADAEFAAHWQRLRENFHMLYDTPKTVAELRQAVLQLAVRGKLVLQDTSDEPSSVLLDRIATEKARLFEEGKIGKQGPLPPIPQDETRLPVPDGWEWVRFGRVMELISGQHLTPDLYNERGDGLPYLTGPADFGDFFPTASRWTHERRAVAKKGDILLTVKGAGVGKTNVLRYDEAAISRQLMAIRPVLVDARFVDLLAHSATERFRAEQIGIAIPGIGRDDVLRLGVPLPPMAEQHRIVAKMDELMTRCNALEMQLRGAREGATQLAVSVVHHLTAA